MVTQLVSWRTGIQTRDSVSSFTLSIILSWLPDSLLPEPEPLGKIKGEKNGHFLVVFVLNLLQLLTEFSLPRSSFLFPVSWARWPHLLHGGGESWASVWPPARTAQGTAIFHLPRRRDVSLPTPTPYFIVNYIFLPQDPKLLPGPLVWHGALDLTLQHQSACSKRQVF